MKNKKSLDHLKTEVEFEQVKKFDFPTDLDFEESYKQACDELEKWRVVFDILLPYRDPRVKSIMDDFCSSVTELVDEAQFELDRECDKLDLDE